jgi:hypothetical protein
MTEHTPAEVLRHQLATFRKNNRFAPYSPPIRRQAIQYTKARTIQGATPSTIAPELGVAITTVQARQRSRSNLQIRATAGAARAAACHTAPWTGTCQP